MSNLQRHVAALPRELDIKELLQLCIDEGASDLHLTEHEPPILRLDGKLRRAQLPVCTRLDLQTIIYQLLSDEQQVQFEMELELDFAVSFPGQDRFRANVHRQRGAIEAAFRRVPRTIPTLHALGVPPAVVDLVRRPNGLVLITGPTGMGKTTTLASLVDTVNAERECLIVTIEDPIEFLYTNNRSVIKQREVHSDTRSFAIALRQALRQDPDVIVVGEMRDLETISTALTAAETGHLVLATLHTLDAPQTIERIIDVFSPHQQPQVQMQLANCLHGIATQMLLPHAGGQGQVLATEVLVATPGIRNLIREHQIEQIPSLMQTGSRYGMVTMEKSIAELYRAGLVTRSTALARVPYPEDFDRL